MSNLNWHTPICGTSTWGERVATLEVQFSHFDSDLTISFTSNLNEASTNESFGIRDFVLEVK